MLFMTTMSRCPKCVWRILPKQNISQTNFIAAVGQLSPQRFMLFFYSKSDHRVIIYCTWIRSIPAERLLFTHSHFGPASSRYMDYHFENKVLLLLPTFIMAISMLEDSLFILKRHRPHTILRLFNPLNTSAWFHGWNIKWYAYFECILKLSEKYAGTHVLNCFYFHSSSDREMFSITTIWLVSFAVVLLKNAFIKALFHICWNYIQDIDFCMVFLWWVQTHCI